MQNAAQFWDNAAEKYARSPIADEKAYRNTLERTRSYLSKDDTILEVGCGTGSTALLLADDVREITASDISGNMIRIAMAKARDQAVSNVTFIKADILDETFQGGPYDAVLAHNIIHLLEDIPAALGRLNKLLKPGGIFISKTVCTPGAGASWKLRLIKLILPLMQMVGKAPYVNFMEIETLERIIGDHGFSIIEAGSYSSPSRYIVARKNAQ